MSTFFTALRDATPEQWAQFRQANSALCALLDETWAQFQATQKIAATATVPHEPYAPNISIDDLTHSPISETEMAAFLHTFDRNRSHNDRPFGEHTRINDQDWEVL